MEVKTTEIFKVKSKIFISFYQDFLHYLEKRGLLSKFVHNVEKVGWSLSNVATFDPYSWISSAFIWTYSDEGQTFWQEEDAAWKKHIDSKVEEVRRDILSKCVPDLEISIVVE